MAPNMSPGGYNARKPRLFTIDPGTGVHLELTEAIQEIKIETDTEHYDTQNINGAISSFSGTTTYTIEVTTLDPRVVSLLLGSTATQGVLQPGETVTPVKELTAEDVLNDILHPSTPVHDPSIPIRPQGHFQGPAELVLEPVYALRVFDADNQGTLRSIVSSHGSWTTGLNLSQHRGSYYEVDHTFKADCTCGFWAYYNFDGQHIGDFLWDGCRTVRKPRNNRILGVIKAHGEVVMGEKGIRAQKAEIVALCAPGSLERYDKRLQAIAQNYPGVPIYFNADDMVKAHPLTDPPQGSTVKLVPSEDSRKRGVKPLIKSLGEKKSVIERFIK